MKDKQTATERFIEDMLRSGWRKGKFSHTATRVNLKTKDEYTIFVMEDDTIVTFWEALLSPDTFQAVGKVRGELGKSYYGSEVEMDEWLFWQHTFIDALADGHDITSALEMIES